MCVYCIVLYYVSCALFENRCVVMWRHKHLSVHTSTITAVICRPVCLFDFVEILSVGSFWLAVKLELCPVDKVGLQCHMRAWVHYVTACWLRPDHPLRTERCCMARGPRLGRRATRCSPCSGSLNFAFSSWRAREVDVLLELYLK